MRHKDTTVSTLQRKETTVTFLTTPVECGVGTRQNLPLHTIDTVQCCENVCVQPILRVTVFADTCYVAGHYLRNNRSNDIDQCHRVAASRSKRILNPSVRKCCDVHRNSGKIRLVGVIDLDV